MCLYVHDKALVPVFIVDLLLNVRKGGHARPAGIRDDNIEAAELVQRFFDKILYGRLRRHVGLYQVEAWFA